MDARPETFLVRRFAPLDDRTQLNKLAYARNQIHIKYDAVAALIRYLARQIEPLLLWGRRKAMHQLKTEAGPVVLPTFDHAKKVRDLHKPQMVSG